MTTATNKLLMLAFCLSHCFVIGMQPKKDLNKIIAKEYPFPATKKNTHPARIQQRLHRTNIQKNKDLLRRQERSNKYNVPKDVH